MPNLDNPTVIAVQNRSGYNDKANVQQVSALGISQIISPRPLDREAVLLPENDG